MYIFCKCSDCQICNSQTIQPQFISNTNFPLSEVELVRHWVFFLILDIYEEPMNFSNKTSVCTTSAMGAK